MSIAASTLRPGLGRPVSLSRSVPQQGAHGRGPSSAHSPRVQHRLRLTTRGRIVFSLLAALICAPVGVWFSGLAQADSAALPQEVSVYTVSSGDSIWGIASAVAPPGASTRAVIDQIVDLNGLKSSHLQPGQQLLVPSAGE